jgi:hypothetical protein
MSTHCEALTYAIEKEPNLGPWGVNYSVKSPDHNIRIKSPKNEASKTRYPIAIIELLEMKLSTFRKAPEEDIVARQIKAFESRACGVLP